MININMVDGEELMEIDYDDRMTYANLEGSKSMSKTDVIDNLYRYYKNKDELKPYRLN